MKNRQKLEFRAGSKEELLPGFTVDFPYIASRAEINKYPGQFVPWHWHRSIELFYIENGSLEYYTPKQQLSFSEGTGGFVNSNVLHMTKKPLYEDNTIQLLHIFDPELISGGHGSRIEQKYVMPIIAAPQIEIVAFSPHNREQAELLTLVRNLFDYSDSDIGYEIIIRETLLRIWIAIFNMLTQQLNQNILHDKNDERLKAMMIYIHEHYSEKFTVSDLANATYISERECFRLFKNYLRISPTEYIKSYRLQQACRMLAANQGTISEVGLACGLGDGSYFGKIFKEYADCTPMEYRKKWQDNNINSLK